MSVLGQYYDLPVVSLRAAAWRLMHAGVKGFMVDKVTILAGKTSLGNTSHVIPLADAAEKDDYFYMDSMHPDPSKLRVLAELVIQPLAAAIEEVAAGVTVEERQDTRLQGLPPPMIPGVKDGSASVCYMLEEFKPLVTDARGFEYRPERPGAPNFVQQKWGWTGLQPGDWAELEVDTEQLRPRSPHNAIVWIMYLTSWEGMGTANVTCVSGCTCEPKQAISLAPGATVSVFQLVGLTATLHPQCRIRVEIIGQQVPGLQQKFMLSALMVAPA
ncbi:hypothetical protein COHA_000486 [Chlorella ohadii]|uniref:Uncharacterized protein n=1 Tax=Chlorella ohadii TaxID=2649997 RepID=A0AAD5E0T9_9CHLO|nr:hypothetical protein COHA_000486 [Chlorella ohadii]